MDTIRILIAIDVPTEQLAESYGVDTQAISDALLGNRAAGEIAIDLDASLSARMEEFYPNNDYAQPVNVTAVAVERHLTPNDTPVTAVSATTLRGVWEVGSDV